MSTLVFRLRNVPDDEAEDIRSLLTSNDIQFFETTAGNWGISMPGIWLESDNDVDRAKTLIDEYQQQRAYEARHNPTPSITFLDSLKQHPGRAIGVFGFCAVVLYFLIKPFYNLI